MCTTNVIVELKFSTASTLNQSIEMVGYQIRFLNLFEFGTEIFEAIQNSKQITAVLPYRPLKKMPVICVMSVGIRVF